MDRFVGATKVWLRGSDGHCLWAAADQYTVLQKKEDRNEMAMWRVEIVNSTRNGKSDPGKQTLRLKSCFGTYLTAMDFHHEDVLFTAINGKRVAQMLPENVESTAGFDWEPVIVDGVLMLKSCFGTYLRRNAHHPLHYEAVSHGHYRAVKVEEVHCGMHRGSLDWSVEKVTIPNVIPLELAVGQMVSKSFEPHFVASERQNASKRIDSTVREQRQHVHDTTSKLQIAPRRTDVPAREQRRHDHGTTSQHQTAPKRTDVPAGERRRHDHGTTSKLQWISRTSTPIH